MICQVNDKQTEGLIKRMQLVIGKETGAAPGSYRFAVMVESFVTHF